MVTDRSAWVFTVVVAVAELFVLSGSPVAADAEAVLVSVPPFGVLGLTCITSWKVAVAPTVSVATVQETVPVAPTAGDVQLKDGPLACVTETKVVLAGVGSWRVTVWASLGPLLLTVTV